MSRVPVLRELSVSCQDATVRIAWRWAGGDGAQVRALRSTQWFCDSPDAHIDGDWGQRVLYEGDADSVVDPASDDTQDTYYSVFARRGPQAPWRRPLRVCVRKAGYQPPSLGMSLSGSTAGAELYAPGRLIDGRYVEIGGDHEAPPAVGGSREWGLVLVPAITIGLLMGFLMGVDVRIITVAALAIAACWRLLDGARPDLRRFAHYLKIVALADGVFWAAALLFSFFAAMLSTQTTVRISASILLFWLYPILLLAGMAGVWLFTGRALDASGKPAHMRPFAVLAGLLVLAAVAAAVACALAAVFALYDLRRAAVALRADRTAEMQSRRSVRRGLLRDTYKPWLAADDENERGARS